MPSKKDTPNSKTFSIGGNDHRKIIGGSQSFDKTLASFCTIENEEYYLAVKRRIELTKEMMIYGNDSR